MVLEFSIIQLELERHRIMRRYGEFFIALRSLLLVNGLLNDSAILSKCAIVENKSLAVSPVAGRYLQTEL